MEAGIAELQGRSLRVQDVGGKGAARPTGTGVADYLRPEVLPASVLTAEGCKTGGSAMQWQGQLPSALNINLKKA